MEPTTGREFFLCAIPHCAAPSRRTRPARRRPSDRHPVLRGHSRACSRFNLKWRQYAEKALHFVPSEGRNHSACFIVTFVDAAADNGGASLYLSAVRSTTTIYPVGLVKLKIASMTCHKDGGRVQKETAAATEIYSL